VNATIAVAVVPPPRAVPRARRASDQPTIQAEALPPSQQHTMAVPAVPLDEAAIEKGLTVIPTAKTVFAGDSSCELPFDAEIVFEPAPPKPTRGQRRITLGDGVLERLPQRRAWFVPTLVAALGVAVAVVAGVAF
jgi:hypothetical protein